MSISPVADRDAKEIVIFGIAEEPVTVDLNRSGGTAHVTEGGQPRAIASYDPPFAVDDVRVDDMNGNTVGFTLLGSDTGNLLFSANGDDLLRGFDGKDQLSGAGGRDTLAGGSGRDLVAGGNGTDFLGGGGNRDVLNGGGGRDTLDGGNSGDELTGGAGNDTFVLRIGKAQGDVVTDFEGAGVKGGDILLFKGFGPGAEVTNTGVADQFVVTDNNGASEVFTLEGVGFELRSNDYAFV